MKLWSTRMAGAMPAGEPATSDEISSLALEMIRRYPSDAIIRAEACYDAFLARGRVDKALTWWRIKAAIAELRFAPSPPGSEVNSGTL
jgi:hypothetical protein